MKLLTPREICMSLRLGDKIYIVEDGNGTWEIFDHVDAWMDIEDVALVSGRRLPMEDYRKTWDSYSIEDTDKEVLETLDQHSFLSRRSTNPAQSAYYSGLRNMADMIYSEHGITIEFDEETEKHYLIKLTEK